MKASLDHRAHHSGGPLPRWDHAGLSARPFHDPAEYSFTARLERNAPRILRELVRNLAELEHHPHPMGAEIADGAWDALFLYSLGKKQAARFRVRVAGPFTELELPPVPVEPKKVVFNDLEGVLAEVKTAGWD